LAVFQANVQIKGNAMKGLSEGGMAATLVSRLRASGSPLPAPEDWPQSLRTAVDIVIHAPMPMVLLWGPQLCQLYNDSFALLAGSKHPRAFGQPVDLIWPELRPFTDSIYQAVLGGEVRSYVEQGFSLPRGDHEAQVWLDLTYSPVRDESGHISGILVTAIEANARLEVQAELQRRSQASTEMHQRLQEEMQERERAEDALRHAQKMEAVGQLTGGIAHDFNNMLTGIMGSLDLMQRYIANGRSAEIARFAEAAVTSAQRAAALTHRLLAFSRRQSLNRQRIDPNQLVHSLEELLSRTKGEHIELRIRFGHDIWPVDTDANQLENALLNLVINARDAMPDGGVLRVETANCVLDGSLRPLGLEPVIAGEYVMISVTDTGSGMSPAVLAKAFDPFFTTKPTGQGTGLGLSMIYGFAQQSGGHVNLHSTVGEGTGVHLYLPRHADTADVENVMQTPENTPRAQQGESVLVVEDDQAVRMLVLNVLDELGYRGHPAADARTAIPLLESSLRIDLLVTDVGLPGLNGRQLAEIARQHRPGLKVLFMTGYAEKAAEKQHFLDDATDMVAKPFTIDVLANKIRDMINA
jgi:signal transduction histidine kinase/ActR/RegA family two-component response regulator